MKKEDAIAIASEMVDNLYELGSTMKSELDFSKVSGRRWVSDGKEHMIQVIPSKDNNSAGIFIHINGKMVVQFCVSSLGLMMLSGAMDNLFYNNIEISSSAINARISVEKEMEAMHK